MNEQSYSIDVSEVGQVMKQQAAATQRTIDEVSRQTIPIIGASRVDGVTPQYSGVSIGDTDAKFHLKSIEASKQNSPLRLSQKEEVVRSLDFTKSGQEQDDITSPLSSAHNKDGETTPQGLTNFIQRINNQSKSTSPQEMRESH